MKTLIKKFSRAKILVVGDLILDQYIRGDVDRVSPEAPVPVVWAKRRNYVPGGAANVANNIASLGGKVSLLGVVGNDAHSRILFSELKKRNICSEGVFREPGRWTTLKTRVIAGHQQVVRVDWEHTQALSKELNQKIIRFIKSRINDFNGFVIEDYGKGVINASVLAELTALAHQNRKIIVVDPKEDNFGLYRGVTCITPNRKELVNAVRNLKIKDSTNTFRVNNDLLDKDRDIDSAAEQIIEYLGLESLLLTLGEEGMRLFESNGFVARIPTVAQEVFDVSGAGDTVAAVFTLALVCGAKKLGAARLANIAAGIVVGKVGTAVVTKEELLEGITGKD